MTEIEQLIKQVRKEGNGHVKIVEGSTNGRPVLHVSKPDAQISRTIRTSADWQACPNILNQDNKHIEDEV
jgi:hypothetical protein